MTRRTHATLGIFFLIACTAVDVCIHYTPYAVRRHNVTRDKTLTMKEYCRAPADRKPGGVVFLFFVPSIFKLPSIARCGDRETKRGGLLLHCWGLFFLFYSHSGPPTKNGHP